MQCHIASTMNNLTSNNERRDLIFQPHPLIRSRHFQTVGPAILRSKAKAMRNSAREMIIEAGDGVRLQGFYSPQPAGQSKGLALLLHGWLGSADSGYVINAGEYLYEHGYAIFRLNFRDHGHTCHLNPEPFRGDRLDEVFTVTQRIAQLEDERPFYIVGFSLGGNYALRLAQHHSQSPFSKLEYTIAFSPAVDPHRNISALDSSLSIYLFYFRYKWCQAFKEKQAACSDRYDFSEEIAARTGLDMNRAFARNHTPYEGVTAYFDSYTVTPDMMTTLQSPVKIIAAHNDPIVPTKDVEAFQDASPHLQVHIQPYGGRVGFIDIFPLRHWSGRAARSIIES